MPSLACWTMVCTRTLVIALYSSVESVEIDDNVDEIFRSVGLRCPVVGVVDMVQPLLANSSNSKIM